MTTREWFEKIVVDEISSSTGPTGGWLDSPKAICAAIITKIRAYDAGVQAERERAQPTQLGTCKLDGDPEKSKSHHHGPHTKNCYCDNWTATATPGQCPKGEK